MVRASSRAWGPILAAAAVAAVTAGCRSDAERGGGQARGRALTNGDPVDGGYEGTVRVAAAAACSGTLLTETWVLTAAHCFSAANLAEPGGVTVHLGGTRTAPEQSHTAREIVRSSFDLALVRLDGAFKVVNASPAFRRWIYPTAASTLTASTVACVGWGVADETLGPPDQPSWAALLEASASGPLVHLRVNDRGQQMSAGDAGGGCFAGQRGFVVAIMVGVDGTGDTVAVDLTRPAVRSWIEGTMTARASDIPASAAAAPAVVRRSDESMALFWVDPQGVMQSAALSAPDKPVSLGAPPNDPLAADAPAAAYLGGYRNVFARSISGALYRQSQAPGAAATTDQDWIQMAGPRTARSNVALSSWEPDRIDVFTIATPGNVLHFKFSGGEWQQPPEDLGGMFDAGVAALAGTPYRIDLFATSDGHVLHKWTFYDAWAYPQWGDEVGGQVASNTTVVAWLPVTLDFFARNAAGHLAHLAYDDFWPAEWTDTLLPIPGPPVAAVAGGQIHLFARNDDGSLWHAYWPR